MNIKRTIQSKIPGFLKPNKVLLILGARRTGKTVLLRQLTEGMKEKYLLLNGEDIITHDLFRNRSVENFRTMLGNCKLLIIDEAQKIPDIGHCLKLIVDNIERVKVIATGSSAFDLTGTLGEPLTGRKITFYLFPLAQMELSAYENRAETRAQIEERLIYGSYPELFSLSSKEEKSAYLKEVVNSYLLKDILSYKGIHNSGKIIDLLRLIGFQCGSEVSLEELGQQLGMSKNTVFNYLDLLSKVFVVFNVRGFSRNPRGEITKKSKWYFYDNGIRNTLIANLNPLFLRNDQGQLWENYMISERIKYQSYTGMLVNNYFWRTYRQEEIDWVEERGGNLYGYEFKWGDRKARVPSDWKKSYPGAGFDTITSVNYLKWII